MQQSFEKHRREFLDHLRFQKRYSAHTVISYENDLAVFESYVATQFSTLAVEDVRTTFIRSWLAELKENKLASRTLNRKISSLRSFFKYLLKKGAVTVNPVTAVISPKMPKRLPQFVNEADMNTLFQTLAFPDSFRGRTERLIMQLLYQTGMRKSELIGISDYHVDVRNSTIVVLGKGNKERILPVQPSLMRELKTHIAEKKTLFREIESRHLFLTERGEAFDPKVIYNIVKKYLAQVTTIEKKSPHILRHSFATHLMNNGAELNAVKELLGHSSLAATQVYTHNSIEKLKDIYKQAHPKA